MRTPGRAARRQLKSYLEYAQATDFFPAAFRRWAARKAGWLVERVAGEGANRALIVYISSPFNGLRQLPLHSNVRDARALVGVLASRGYKVDVLDHSSPIWPDVLDYDLIVGFGLCVENTLAHSNRPRVIGYLQTAPPDVSHDGEVQAFRRATELGLDVDGLPRRDHGLKLFRTVHQSDALFAAASPWALQRWKEVRPDVRAIAPSLSVANSFAGNVDRLEEGHIWFGSSGLLHKGLDIAVAAMATADPAIRRVLHVCGVSPAETRLLDSIAAMYPGVQIVNHGRVDPHSDAMRQLMRRVRFVCLPSASEGCSTGVLTCMAYGCIPIVSIPADTGFPGSIVARDLSVDAFRVAVRIAADLSLEERRTVSAEASLYALSKHGDGAFEDSFSRAMDGLLA